MTIKPDDPRLTAYALGELEPGESAELEALLKENPAAESEISAIRETAALLESELAATPALELSEEQRSRVITGGDEPRQKIITPGPDAFSRTSRWLGITAAAACVATKGAWWRRGWGSNGNRKKGWGVNNIINRWGAQTCIVMQQHRGSDIGRRLSGVGKDAGVGTALILMCKRMIRSTWPRRRPRRTRERRRHSGGCHGR